MKKRITQAATSFVNIFSLTKKVLESGYSSREATRTNKLAFKLKSEFIESLETIRYA